MNPLYRASEVTYVLGKAGAAACFVEPENRGASLWSMLGEAASQVPSLRQRVAFGDAPDAAGPSLEEWIDAGSAVSDAELDRRQAEVRPADTSQIQFTSGTTGFPKGAELNNAGIVNNARLFVHRAGIYDHGRHCNPMPFFHCGGCVMSTLGMIATGSAQLPTLTFDAARMVRTIDAEQALSAGAVPTMLIALDEEVDRSGGSLQSLELVVTGGSPVPVDVERHWIERYGVSFTITYGLTEASPVITQSSPTDPEHLQIATCGPPLPHCEVDVVDVATRERVALGEQGELRTRGVDGDERLLGRGGGHARGDRGGRLALLGRPRAHGRERLRVDHRPRQGDDHPRRREHLPGGGRGRAARAPRHRSTRAWSACPTTATGSRSPPSCGSPTAPR